MALKTSEKRVVDQQVAQLLGRSPAFQALSVRERAEILDNTRRVAESMVEGKLATSQDPYARSLEIELPTPPGSQTGTAGSSTPGYTNPNMLRDRANATGPAAQRGDANFGTAIDKGMDQIARLVDEVGFPEFCAALIQGVFQSIVDTSIQQMRAYADMVKSVTSSLSEFKDQNVSPNQGRDHLVSKYPRLFQINIGQAGPSVGVRPDADTDQLPDFQRELGLSEPVEDIDDETIENVLVDAARTDLARGRQQLLATLVLMGINRIVVTDGKIKAKVKINFQSQDIQHTTAQQFDYENMGTVTASQGTRESQYTGSEYNRTTEGEKTTVSRSPASRYLNESYQTSSQPLVVLTNQTMTDTDAQLSASAEMMGEVSINFKSETFPLEKLVSTDQITTLQSTGQGMRGTPNTAPGTPPATTSPAPV